jgi:hypothetical protein
VYADMHAGHCTAGGRDCQMAGHHEGAYVVNNAHRWSAGGYGESAPPLAFASRCDGDDVTHGLVLLRRMCGAPAASIASGGCAIAC